MQCGGGLQPAIMVCGLQILFPFKPRGRRARSHILKITPRTDATCPITNQPLRILFPLFCDLLRVFPLEDRRQIQRRHSRNQH